MTTTMDDDVEHVDNDNDNVDDDVENKDVITTQQITLLDVIVFVFSLFLFTDLRQQQPCVHHAAKVPIGRF